MFFLKQGERISGNEIDLVVEECFPGNIEKLYVPAYHFKITYYKMDEKIGHVNLRIETSDRVKHLTGHIGYGINPEYQGRNYSAKACNLLLPILKKHRINPVFLTCNPDNTPSIKILEKIGAEYIETIDVPVGDEMHNNGEFQKKRYKWEI